MYISHLLISLRGSMLAIKRSTGVDPLWKILRPQPHLQRFGLREGVGWDSSVGLLARVM